MIKIRFLLDFLRIARYNLRKHPKRSEMTLSNLYGSDYITISDDDGHEYELEVLNTLEYNGCSYLAVIPVASSPDDECDPQVIIIKSVEENGESILYTIDDEDELSAVNDLLMDSIFSDEDND